MTNKTKEPESVSASPVDALVNRPLVFRAWNKNWQEMEHEVYDISPSEDYVFMQQTGLQDKNGKEIYEGDIIPITFESHENYGIKYGADFTLNGFVRYNHYQARYEIKFPDNEHNIISSEFGWAVLELDVIGNIYENPEKLQKGG